MQVYPGGSCLVYHRHAEHSIIQLFKGILHDILPHHFSFVEYLFVVKFSSIPIMPEIFVIEGVSVLKQDVTKLGVVPQITI